MTEEGSSFSPSEKKRKDKNTKGKNTNSQLLTGDKKKAPRTVKPTIEEAYQKLTQLQHVLKRPDTYVGSTEVHDQEMWVWSEEKKVMELRNVSFPPGLYKIFDEIIVNAADNAQRSKDMKNIKVWINKKEGSFKVWNDGQVIRGRAAPLNPLLTVT